jgi:hypothetical protein
MTPVAASGSRSRSQLTFAGSGPTPPEGCVVKGTAPGIVTGHEQRISNTVHETFTIGG